MTRFKYILASAAIAVCPLVSLKATDFKVVANSSIGVASVSPDDLKAVFLGTKTSLSDGGHVAPVLEKSGPAHEAFLKECVGRSDAALTNYYRSLVFTGKGSMPKTLGSDSEVVEYVAKTKGAIGYVAAGAAVSGAKTLELK